jgi:hypothetical protein
LEAWLQTTHTFRARLTTDQATVNDFVRDLVFGVVGRASPPIGASPHRVPARVNEDLGLPSRVVAFG